MTQEFNHSEMQEVAMGKAYSWNRGKKDCGPNFCGAFVNTTMDVWDHIVFWDVMICGLVKV
jgi:hypothetical protein